MIGMRRECHFSKRKKGLGAAIEGAELSCMEGYVMDAQRTIYTPGLQAEEQRSHRLHQGETWKGKGASTPRKVLRPRGHLLGSEMRRVQPTAGSAAVLGEWKARSHGRKLIGKESKMRKPTRKTPRRKALERWWSFNWFLSAFFCLRINAILTHLVWQNSLFAPQLSWDLIVINLILP